MSGDKLYKVYENSGEILEPEASIRVVEKSSSVDSGFPTFRRAKEELLRIWGGRLAHYKSRAAEAERMIDMIADKTEPDPWPDEVTP